MASSSSAITEVGARLLKGYQWLRRAFQALETAFKKISRMLVQLSGIIICLGAVCAIVGWLLSNLRPDPLGPTWGLGIWLVVLGVFAVALGIMSLTLHYVLRVGMIGLSSVMLLFLGALVVMAGSLAVDLFILPWMAKLFAEFPNLGAVLQSGYNAVQSGVNTASTSVVNAGSSICNALANPFGGSGSCSTNVSGPVPDQTVPSLSVNDLLAKIGLPSVSALGTLGLVFLSGAPLAPGCLLVGLVFLFAGVRPRSALLLLMGAAFLNLGGQFVLHITFLGPLLGVLLYLALAWFGFALWSPWKLSVLAKLRPTEAANKPAEPVESV